MKTVIMAGGKGTRISSIAKDIPKPMIKIQEMPVLEHELYCLRAQGFNDIIISVGYLRNVIMDYFGDGSKISPVTQKPFGVKIEYFIEEQPLGNAGALFQMKDKLKDDFLLLNADAIFDIDFNRFVDFHRKRGGLVTLFTHPNSHPYDSGLITAAKDGSVLQWLAKEDTRPTYYHNRVNAGLHVVSPKVLEMEIPTGKVDLDRQVLKPLAGTGQMFCYDSPEYVKDMGTPDRYATVCRDFADGIVHAKNFKQKQKAVFLDRDGTINEYVGFLTDENAFRLLPFAANAIRKINQSSYLAIVATNQPVIARGECTVEELECIHMKMETELGQQGAYIDGLYYCPHHPHKGYEGEVADLKVDCDCRKPKTGMFVAAANDFNIDLSQSWCIGDTTTDIQAGINAGMKTILVSTGQASIDKRYDVNPTYVAKNLEEAVSIVLKDE